MSYLRTYGPAFTAGVGVTALAGFLILTERPAQTMPNVLDPNPAADHQPVDVWYGDNVAFTCPNCPDGSHFRVDKIELLRTKILNELSGGTGIGNAEELTEELPPRDGLNVPPSPFGNWSFPTGYKPKGQTITTDAVPNTFKAYKSTQFYSVTWTYRRSDGTTETLDPHIYAHGGKRR